jgi:predicted esterase
MSSSSSKPPVQSAPFVFSPKQPHKTTLIILHGRGSTAEKFAEPLLNYAVSCPATTDPEAPSPTTTSTFKDYFPNTKFVFLTAPLRRAVAFNRSLTHQWFDNWSLTEPEVKQHLQIQGLRETSFYLHNLLREEIRVVGAKNVVLMGLSQGCAASIVATLLWDGEPFGAVVGMCGYLPLRKRMQEAADDAEKAESGEDEHDFFERDDVDFGGETRLEKAVACLREELEICDGKEDNRLPATPLTPILMGHGTEDDKVPCGIGKLAADFLGSIDVDITWKEYEGLGHWYSEDMLRDVVKFVKNLSGWSNPS